MVVLKVKFSGFEFGYERLREGNVNSKDGVCKIIGEFYVGLWFVLFYF